MKAEKEFLEKKYWEFDAELRMISKKEHQSAEDWGKKEDLKKVMSAIAGNPQDKEGKYPHGMPYIHSLLEDYAQSQAEQSGVKGYVECEAHEATGIFTPLTIENIANGAIPLKKAKLTQPTQESAEERYRKAKSYLKEHDRGHEWDVTITALKIAAGLTEPPKDK